MDNILNIKDSVFISERHKHEKRLSQIICRPFIKEMVFLSGRDTHEKQCS